MFLNPIHPLNPANPNSPLNPDYIDQHEKVELAEQPASPEENKSDTTVWAICGVLIFAVVVFAVLFSRWAIR